MEMALITNFQANLGEKDELTFEEFRTVMAAYRKDIEKANLAVNKDYFPIQFRFILHFCCCGRYMAHRPKTPAPVLQYLLPDCLKD